MKTQTIFSDPLIAHSIACAISRRAENESKRGGFLKMVIGWAKFRTH